jgi:hypothetical protein
MANFSLLVSTIIFSVEFLLNPSVDANNIIKEEIKSLQYYNQAVADNLMSYAEALEVYNKENPTAEGLSMMGRLLAAMDHNNSLPYAPEVVEAAKAELEAQDNVIQFPTVEHTTPELKTLQGRLEDLSQQIYEADSVEEGEEAYEVCQQLIVDLKSYVSFTNRYQQITRELYLREAEEHLITTQVIAEMDYC